jgi:4-aminobutyrate aminotransferase / (S)-3-amino-2-methylpropionate transaminase
MDVLPSEEEMSSCMAN